MSVMKCHVFAVAIWFSLAGATVAVMNEDKSLAPRPRLFYTAEKIARLRERVKTDDVVRQAWQRQLERADGLLDDKLVTKEYAEGGAGQHGNYGRPSSQIVQMGGTLGLAWRMTGDKRYAEKLKRALIHFGTFNRWAGDARHDPPWHSELNTARFCFGYAIGFDSIGDYLSKSDRKTIAAAMVRLGIGPTLDDWVLGEKRIHALDSMGHNWWSVCVSMAGLAAMSVMGDVPQADAWVRTVNDAFGEWFCYSGNILQNKSTNFDRNGAFYESVNYANYALSEYLLFRLAWLNAFPDTPPAKIPLLEKAGDFFVHTCYPTSESVLSANFGDSSIKAGGARTLRLLLANGFDKPQYRWYVNRTDPGLNDPVGLVYYDGQPTAGKPESAESILYPDIGWATMRSSWADDATMLAVKSGFAWNHAHPDAGSFILFHDGKPLIIDSGNCSYSRREYSSYYRRSKAHNVILTNGAAEIPESCGHGDRGTATEGSVHRLIDGAGIKYIFADATGPTAWKFSRNYRHFLWIDDVILIFDDVRTHEPGKLEWLLHYQDSHQVRDGDICISSGDAKVIVRPMFPENTGIVEKKGLKDHDPDTEVTYLALSPNEETRQQKFITAILPVNRNRKPPALELLQQDEAIGVRISADGVITDVWLNLRADGRKMHRNSCNTIAGWETDAYLFAVTRPKGSGSDDPDAAMRYFVACGSYLRKDGKVVLDSLSKLYTVFTVGKAEMEIVLEGQPVINAALRAKDKPRILIINGKNADTAYDKAHACVKVRLDRR